MLGPHAHCFFVEPTASPCFLLGLLAEAGTRPLPSVHDAGLDNRTEADGLQVPRASELAVAAMRPLLAGVCTVDDATLLRHLWLAHEAAGLRLEPSAAAGFVGPRLAVRVAPRDAPSCRATGLDAALPHATHLVWTTGGLLVPDARARAPRRPRARHARGRLSALQRGSRRSLRSSSAGVSRSRTSHASSPSTSTSAARPRLL